MRKSVQRTGFAAPLSSGRVPGYVAFCEYRVWSLRCAPFGYPVRRFCHDEATLDNTNALPEEEDQERASASRIYMDSPAVKEEIALHARHFWQERGGAGDAPEPEDWERAKSFVRNRIQASQTA